MNNPSPEATANLMKLSAILLGIVFTLASCSTQEDIRLEAQEFIDQYTETFKDLSYGAARAEWRSNTHIVAGDDSNAQATRRAREALAAFTGSVETIAQARSLLENQDQLLGKQKKQLRSILFLAADSPQTVPDLVKQRIAKETEQVEKLYGFNFKVDGRTLTTNEIDRILRTSSNLTQRQKVWEASKEVGKELKEGLESVRDLRNRTVQALDYHSYFSYQVSEYDMTVKEMMALMDKFNRELRPLYRELHTWARYQLAKKYGKPVPDSIPAHWLPNRWGQDWGALVRVKGLDLNAALENKSPEWMIRQAEKFYVSLGFEELPESFWKQSSLYPLPKDASYKKNNHASAWHMDLEDDIRCLMSVENNADWYETVHHELGHIYYYRSYTRPEVPPLLRAGANRAFHEAIGSLMGLAATQKAFLAGQEMVPKNARVDQIQALLKEALSSVVFIPFSAGTMSRFEHDLYEKNLPADQYNQRWWELARKYQGIEPPTARGEEYCDAASKTHISDDAAQYYDYTLSYILLYQLHDTIANNILKQDPHDTNYWGNRQVGIFLDQLMRPGSTGDWRQLIREITGDDLSAQAMLTYYAPLMDYLKKVNRGRKHTLPEL